MEDAKGAEAVKSEITPSVLTTKQSEKRTSIKKGTKKYQDPDCQVFQKVPGADDGNNINCLSNY